MTQLMNQIEWAEPILPIFEDSQWESEVKSDLGTVPDMLQRVAPSAWLREACLKWDRIPIREFPARLADIGTLVTAQENACRYCYGAAKAQMRMFGYTEKMINGIEREMQLAELDEKDRAFIRFCRNLARSKPRPAKAERDNLVELGFSPLAVSEMAFFIANHCFYNRVATFIACPPLFGFENLAGSFLGRLIRPLIAKKLRARKLKDVGVLSTGKTRFSGVVQALKGLPAATFLHRALEGVFESSALSQELKILMFAVVARTLGCTFCEAESRELFVREGLAEDEFDACLSTLNSPRFTPEEAKILAWTRETVHFQTNTIQKQTRQLAEEVGNEMLLEAIGISSLANSTARLASLLE